MQMDILPSRDYYRDLVRYQTEQSSIASLWLAVINEGDTAINEGDTAVRDVHMEMTALVTSGVVNLRMIQPHIPSRLLTSTASVTLSTGQPPELVIGQQDGDEWAMHLDLPVVQGGRSIAAREGLRLQVLDDASVEVTATVYSSAAPPFTVEIPLHLRVEIVEMLHLDLLDELEPAAAAELRQ